MRTLNRSTVADGLAVALRENWRADYVYAYPPRQAYHPIPQVRINEAIAESLAPASSLNLYVHVPFCRQICSYCNLYAVAGRNTDDHENYVDLIEQEFHQWDLAGQDVLSTVYVGGGTPSLLRPQLIERLLVAALTAAGRDLKSVAEVALEVAPDTVTAAKLVQFRSAGINRINLGVQSWDDNDIRGIGRAHSSTIHHDILAAAMNTGFDNVCVDLIYGLPHQSTTTWERSLRAVLAHDPDTICCYALTLRPNTGYAAQGQLETDAAEQYAKYDLATALLADAGYIQETHVRWIRPGRGGYIQKANHWAGQNIIGVGAGARSYLREADLRNGYSSRKRRRVLTDWGDAVRHGRSPISDGYPMSNEERARKAMILGLGSLDRQQFVVQHGQDPVTMFDRELDLLEQHGLIEVTGDTLAWTQLGQRHRDVGVQLFFSDEVSARLASFDYANE